MVQPEIKHVLSFDVPDLRSYRPEEEAFAVFVRAIIGPHGERGEESFDFTVCSPEWIKQHCTEPMLGLHLLIVPSYNYEQFTKFLEKLVRACAAETWDECASKLQRIGSWEFEGYEARS